MDQGYDIRPVSAVLMVRQYEARNLIRKRAFKHTDLTLSAVKGDAFLSPFYLFFPDRRKIFIAVFKDLSPGIHDAYGYISPFRQCSRRLL